MPGPNSRVCSAHFAGGKKSKKMHDEAYVPTIFPKIYKRKLPNVDRREKLRKRNIKKQIASEETTVHEQVALEINNTGVETGAPMQEKKIHIGIQTEPCVVDCGNEVSVVFCWIEENNARQPDFFRKLEKEDRLLLFLTKLKLGITFCALGTLFHVHSTTAARIFFQVLETLTAKTKSWIFWISKDSIRKNFAKSFHKYPNCRCIIDCTEMPTDIPPTVEQRVLMYSNYEERFTVEFLIAITPDGFICKVSEAYRERSTDSFITNDSGFLNLLEPGDLVLTDKGFPQIQSELKHRNATLVIPPFGFNPQFTDEEVGEGYTT